MLKLAALIVGVIRRVVKPTRLAHTDRGKKRESYLPKTCTKAVANMNCVTPRCTKRHVIEMSSCNSVHEE